MRPRPSMLLAGLLSLTAACSQNVDVGEVSPGAVNTLVGRWALSGNIVLKQSGYKVPVTRALLTVKRSASDPKVYMAEALGCTLSFREKDRLSQFAPSNGLEAGLDAVKQCNLPAGTYAPFIDPPQTASMLIQLSFSSAFTSLQRSGDLLQFSGDVDATPNSGSIDSSEWLSFSVSGPPAE
jgi:hypothetical protein